MMRLLEMFRGDPKKLFLVDALGAALSAFLLGIVLVEFYQIFGMPRDALYLLASLPVFFMIFDIYCYKQKSSFWSLGLRTIARLNLAYCIFSLGLSIYHRESITYLGWTYILFEILIIILLASIELKLAQALKQK